MLGNSTQELLSNQNLIQPKISLITRSLYNLPPPPPPLFAYIHLNAVKRAEYYNVVIQIDCILENKIKMEKQTSHKFVGLFHTCSHLISVFNLSTSLSPTPFSFISYRKCGSRVTRSIFFSVTELIINELFSVYMLIILHCCCCCCYCYCISVFVIVATTIITSKPQSFIKMNEIALCPVQYSLSMPYQM